MVALSLWRESRCEGCGGDLNETLSIEDWEALPPLRCHKCTAIHIAQAAFNGPHPMALRYAAEPRKW